VDVSELVVIAYALHVTFDEDVARLFTRDNVDVVQRHFVRVPDHAPQLVAIEHTQTHRFNILAVGDHKINEMAVLYLESVKT